MNSLLKAFVEREIKSIFGGLATRITCNYDEDFMCLVVLITNIDRTRSAGKEIGSISIAFISDELNDAKFPLDIFKVKVESAYKQMVEHLKEAA